MPKVKYVEVEELPKCPYCDKDLNVIHTISKGFIAQIKAFICPHCRKLLGIAYNLGA